MKASWLGAFVAILFAGLLMPGEVKAAPATEYGNGISGCGNAYRIPVSDATCLSASWSGATYSITHECKDYGTLAARVDKISCRDVLLFFDAGDDSYSTTKTCHVRKITCCLDRSEICYTNQVEADSRGRITVVENSNGTVTAGWATVSTHQQRYDFCQDNPDNIYCEVDPQGDANTDPNAECNEDTDPPCNCGDHYCKVEDCTSAYEESQASDSCTNDMFSNHSMSISATNGSSQDCTMEGQCMARIETVNRDPEPPYQVWIWDDVEITTDVENMDDLRNCGGALTTDASCSDNNQID